MRLSRLSDPEAVGQFLRGVPLRTRWWVESRRDIQSLRGTFPSLPRVLRAKTDELRPFRDAYVREVSTDVMAASLPVSALLAAICQVCDVRRAVDLGSGFSSLVLRRELARDEEAARTWSVDDSTEWLKQTENYLRENGMRTDGLLSWADVDTLPIGSFDLVFHDLGNIAERIAAIPTVLTLARPGGMVIFDDVHKHDLRSSLERALNDAGLRPFRLWSWTRDRYGRHAWLVIR